MAVKTCLPQQPLYNAVVVAGPAVQSLPFNLSNMGQPQAVWVINVGVGLTASFQVVVSLDGTTYYNVGQNLPAASGTAITFPVEYDGGFPWVAISVLPTVGSGQVTITGGTKGV